RGRLRGRPPAPPGGPVGGARRPRRRGGRARGGRGVAHARRPRGTAAAAGAGRPPRRRRGGELGRPEHAGRRCAAARLHRLPPASPDVGGGPPRLSPGSRVRQRGARPARPRDRRDLRGGRAAAGPSPIPRALGGGAEPGRLAGRRGPASPPGGGGDVRGRRAGIRVGAAGRARGVAAMTALDPRVPSGPLETRWTRHRDELALVGPTRRRFHSVLVIGAGLAGASAAATLSELGYRVRCLVFHDSPRRAHSVAAQGGINAAKNYQNDGDSVTRLFHDTLEGGDFRSRESNVYRLAELSARIIDHAVAQGVPFAREYGGHLANRSFGGTRVSRTFY